MRTVVCVIGSVASGKSHHVTNNYDPERHVIFAPGRVIRQAAGSSFMKDLSRPNAPAELDHLVISLFGDLLKLAESLDRDLVCDGFPRTSAQALVMLDMLDMRTEARNRVSGSSIAIRGYTVNVMIMRPQRHLVEARLAERGDDFDSVRFNSSVEDLAEVLNVMTEPPPFVKVTTNEVI